MCNESSAGQDMSMNDFRDNSSATVEEVEEDKDAESSYNVNEMSLEELEKHLKLDERSKSEGFEIEERSTSSECSRRNEPTAEEEKEENINETEEEESSGIRKNTRVEMKEEEDKNT